MTFSKRAAVISFARFLKLLSRCDHIPSFISCALAACFSIYPYLTQQQQSWLLEAGSLTAKLKSHCQAFQLKF